MSHRYATAGRLTADQARAAVARLACGLPGLRSCRLDPVTREIVIEMDGPGDVAGAIEHAVAAASRIRVARPRVLKRTPENPSPLAGEEVRPRTGGGDAEEVALDLAESVDRALLGIARAAGARRRAYGSLVSLATMARCDYLRSFPQNAYLVAELPHDWRALERLEDAPDVASLARLSEYMLSPAVCFHCYEELAGRELPGPLVLTAIGTCFRHEAAWRVGGPRLREFTMREIVFYGDAGFVDAMRTRLMDQVWAWFERLGLAGRIETASDPFYLPADSVKAQYQLMASAKYELVACLPGGEEVVLGSFNDVGDTLCGPFGITCGGVPARSGCVALGIQRWVYALQTRSFQQ